MRLRPWEASLKRAARAHYAAPGSAKFDAAHDWLHIERVARNALRIGKAEGGDPEVLLAAAWFHDAVKFPRGSKKAPLSARLSARAAAKALKKAGFPAEKVSRVCEAIEHHSWSYGSAEVSLEARILQDADRLEIVGALAVARTFASAALHRTPFYDGEDPFARRRKADGNRFAFDFFPDRLFKVPARLHTSTAKRIARQRVTYLKGFLAQLKAEIL